MNNQIPVNLVFDTVHEQQIAHCLMEEFRNQLVKLLTPYAVDAVLRGEIVSTEDIVTHGYKGLDDMSAPELLHIAFDFGLTLDADRTAEIVMGAAPRDPDGCRPERGLITTTFECLLDE